MKVRKLHRNHLRVQFRAYMFGLNNVDLLMPRHPFKDVFPKWVHQSQTLALRLSMGVVEGLQKGKR